MVMPTSTVRENRSTRSTPTVGKRVILFGLLNALQAAQPNRPGDEEESIREFSEKYPPNREIIGKLAQLRVWIA